jgi:hypothetical protein
MFSARFLYLFGRAAATFASLVLALVYSRDLGLVNRSSLAMIMTTNAILWIVLSSGATLTIRKIGWANTKDSTLNSLATVIISQYIIIILLYLTVINLYSQIKNPIAFNLVLLSLIYVTTSGIHLIAMEILLSTEKIKSVGVLEIATVSSQISIYFVSSLINELSVATRLLLAFIFSYLLVSVIAIYLIAKTKRIRIKLGAPQEFIHLSRYNHFFGASLGFMDRIDRLLVGFLLATPVLGKYAVATTLITLLRFLPDGISKLIIAKKVTLNRINLMRKELIFAYAFVLTSAVIIISRESIYFFLGREWILGVSIYVAIAMQELMRGSYQIMANKNVLHGHSKSVHTAATLLPLISISAGLLGTKLFGLIGIPGALCATYIFGIAVLRRRVVA